MLTRSKKALTCLPIGQIDSAATGQLRREFVINVVNQIEMSSMNRNQTVVILFILAVVLIGCRLSVAQSSTDLVAPLDTLRLASAEATDDGQLKLMLTFRQYQVADLVKSGEPDQKDSIVGIDVGKSELDSESIGKGHPFAGIDDDARMTKTYAVPVPYSEAVIVDGREQESVRYRTEHRPLTVTGRVLKTPSGHDRPVSYKIQIPFEETVNVEGEWIKSTRFRTETRTRFLRGPQQLVKLPWVRSFILETDTVKFFNVDGIGLDADRAVNRFSERLPVILVDKDGQLDLYYQNLVRPNTVLIYTPSLIFSND